MKVISIANEKGGVGKTTTTLNIGAALSALGNKVMLIDLDQQANLSDYLGHIEQGGNTISEALYFKTANLAMDYSSLVRQNGEGLWFIPSSKMLASDSIIIPVQAEKFSFDAVKSTIDTIKRTNNPKLKLEGLLLTMVNKRTNMAKAVEEALRNQYEDKVFKTVIPRLTEATNSTFEQRSLVSDKSSVLGKAYMEIAKEIMKGDINVK